MEENNLNGWVSLHRKSIKWKWYKNPFVKAVFNHCVLTANHEDGFWRNIEVKRGQLITSREKIADANGMTIQQVRTCLTKLVSTNDLIVETTNHYSKITVVNYDKYQTNNGLTSTSTLTQTSTDKSTNKNEDISTNKSTQNITSKSTTNNNILINNNNIYKLNYTKLNLLFNYLINKEKQNFENLKENDKNSIRNILKKIEILIQPEVINYFKEDELINYKLQYWAITEIYLSPYKAFLDNLNKSNFLFRFLKTKQYMNISIKNQNEEELTSFMNYFVTCLRKEIEENGNK